MPDHLTRIVTSARGIHVRGLACVTTELVAEAARLHETSPVATVALGRALGAGALLGALLKMNQRVAMKFEGPGPLGKIIVEADADGSARGYVGDPRVEPASQGGAMEVGAALGGMGLLTVAKDLGLKEPYSGTVHLRSGEIAEDVAYYLTQSEQVPSAMAVGVWLGPEGHVIAAGGFLIQTLPPPDPKIVETLEARISTMPPVTTLLREGTTPDGMLELLFEGISYDVIERRALRFLCKCSRERVEQALGSLGPDELRVLAEEGSPVEVVCEYCRRKHTFHSPDLRALGRVPEVPRA